MQQYRVNWGLLVGLAIGSVAALGVTYVVWKYQLNRNAGALMAKATDAQEKNDLKTAIQEYRNYLSIRGGDDDARLQLANAWADLTDSDQMTPEDWPRAIQFLEETMRQKPDESKLQRRLVDLYGKIGQNQEALDHLQLMVEKNPKDAELEAQLVEFLVRARKYDDAVNVGLRAIGYDDKADKFDAEKATAPHEANLYGTVGALLRSHSEKPALGDRVLEQLVAVNPDSADAYLQRGRYFITYDQPDKGKRDLDKAYKLKPDDADVLIVMADQAKRAGKIDQAREYLERGKKAHPEEPQFYHSLMVLETDQKDLKAALAVVEEGLKAVPGQKGMLLLLAKADLQLRLNDIKGVQATVDQMRKAGFRADYVDWVEAQILVYESKWFPASRALRSLRSNFRDSTGLSDQIDYQLGMCYERLGQYDSALAAYEVVLEHNPKNEPAEMGRKRIQAMTSQPEQKGGEQQDLDERISKEMAKPKADRNWKDIDAALEKLVKERKLEGVALDEFWARIMLQREDYAAAREYVRKAQEKDKDDVMVYRLGVAILRMDPSQGPAKAMGLLDKAVEKFGDQAGLRLDRADLVIAAYDKDTDTDGKALKAQLAKLAEAPNDWKESAKVELYGGMAGRYLAMGMRDEGRTLLDRVAVLKPDELATRLMLFSLALEANDDVGMKAAQDKIKEVVGDTSDSNYEFTEARRLISLYRRGQVGKESLAKARVEIEKALKQRPDWFELHLVNAELELLDGNNQLALEHFDKAEQLGKPNPNAILLHVRLLVASGQYERARKLVEQLPKSVREETLGQLYAEILMTTGHPKDAIEVAGKFVDANPDDPDRRLAFGQMLMRAASGSDVSADRKKELTKQAGEAFQKAVDLGPEAPTAWLALISFHVANADQDNTRKTLQQAQLALSEDVLVGVLAKAYEIAGQWFDAEKMYLTAYQQNPDSLPLTQQLATFYLGQTYPGSDKAAKALPLINKILHAGADRKLVANDASLMWARQMSARILASSKDYQQLRKAELMLASNSQNGVMSTEDRLLMAQILASRPEPVSRVKALSLLEKVSESQKLSLENELMLGQLYFEKGDWSKCKGQMLKAVSRFPTSVDARAEFIRLILLHGDKKDYAEAATQLGKLKDIAPGDSRTIRLNVQLAGKTGKQQEARKYLMGLLPKSLDPKTMTDQQAQLMGFVGSMLVDVEDYDNAEKIFRAIVAKDPNQTLVLAGFLGEHRDVQQSMDLLDKSYKPDDTEQIARIGIAVVRLRDEVHDKYDKQIQQWLDRGLLENPDSIPLQMLQAEFADVRKEYAEAADIYQKLLSRKDLVGPTRAIVLNNLAYLVALSDTAAKAGLDPMQLVQEASQILGPTSDILDTRAVINISKGDYRKALDDLNLAVTDNPTPSKYFHKVVAHLGAGENKAAIESWEKAGQLGDIKNDLNRLEYGQFDEIKGKIDQLRGQSSKLTEADRVRAAG